MSEQGLIQAEQRVREMNRMARQYTEQGNRFIRQNLQNHQTRFEQVRPNNTYGGQDPPRQNGVFQQQNLQAAQTSQTASPEPPLQNPPPLRNRPMGNSPAESSGKAPAGNAAFLSDLKLDNEKLMIILIMYLLIKEKADIKLILALGYLLL